MPKDINERMIDVRRKGGSLLKNKIGCFVVLLGVFVLLALVLPPMFWWFVLGVVLLAAGLWLLRCV